GLVWTQGGVSQRRSGLFRGDNRAGRPAAAAKIALSRSLPGAHWSGGGRDLEDRDLTNTQETGHGRCHACIGVALPTIYASLNFREIIGNYTNDGVVRCHFATVHPENH